MLVHCHSRLSREQLTLADEGYRLGDAYAERETEDGLRGGQLWPSSIGDLTGRGARFHSLDVALCLTGTVSRRWWCSRDAVGHADELFGQRLICKAPPWAVPRNRRESSTWCWIWAGSAVHATDGPLLNDGEVLVFEVDGNCPPTATEQELSKRRGKRQHAKGCACGCQRHRGKAKGKAWGSKMP